MTLLSVLSQDARKVVLKFCVPEQLMALWRVLVWRERGSCTSLLPPPGFWLPDPEMPYKILICLMSFTAFYCLVVFKYGKSWGSSASVSMYYLTYSETRTKKALSALWMHSPSRRVPSIQNRLPALHLYCLQGLRRTHTHTHTKVMCLNSQLCCVLYILLVSFWLSGFCS